MKQISAYTDESEGERRFYVLLECGCTLGVPVGALFDSDANLPCPLHEPDRYLGEYNDAGSGI